MGTFLRKRLIPGSDEHTRYLEYHRALRARHPNYGKQRAALEELYKMHEKGISFCATCKQEKPIGDFYLHWRNKRPRRTCKSCCAEYQRSSGQQASRLARQYYKRPEYKSRARAKATGMTQALWDLSWARQEGCCAICRVSLSHIHTANSHGHKMCADHNHQTKIPRGILCSNCNKAIGFFKDSAQLCRAALEYLEYPTLLEYQ
jgi:Autographiviridae endonuclease VII